MDYVKERLGFELVLGKFNFRSVKFYIRFLIFFFCMFGLTLYWGMCCFYGDFGSFGFIFFSFGFFVREFIFRKGLGFILIGFDWVICYF